MATPTCLASICNRYRRAVRIHSSAFLKLGTTCRICRCFDSPLLLGAEANAVNFYREEGFTQNRLDVVPGLSTDVIDFGHVVGFTPQAKFREVYYTRGRSREQQPASGNFLGGD